MNLGNNTNIDCFTFECLKLLVDSFDFRMPTFHSRPFHVRLASDRTFCDGCFYEYHGFFFPVSLISPMLHPRLFFYNHRHLKIAIDMVVTQHAFHSVNQKDRDHQGGLGVKRVVLR
jgi:hypothetical protein